MAGNELTVNPFLPTNMADAMRLADVMSKGRLVPGHLQGNPGDCLLVIEHAVRWRMSPFALAQCTSVVHDRLMFEGKVVAAALNTSEAMERRLDYEFSGKGDDLQIRVFGTLRGESNAREVIVRLADARTYDKNKNVTAAWQKQPEQQLVYHGSRVWARRWLPEVMLGVYAPEEFSPPPPPRVPPAGKGPVVEGEAEEVQEQPKPTSKRQWLADLAAAFDEAETREAVDEIITNPSVQSALEKFEGQAYEMLEQIITKALNRTATTEG